MVQKMAISSRVGKKSEFFLKNKKKLFFFYLNQFFLFKSDFFLFKLNLFITGIFFYSKVLDCGEIIYDYII